MREFAQTLALFPSSFCCPRGGRCAGALLPIAPGWVCLITLLISAFAAAQPSPSTCPIDFLKIDPHAYPFMAGALGDKDTWDHYLQIEYKNVSGKKHFLRGRRKPCM
jgi:hypothetical protein